MAVEATPDLSVSVTVTPPWSAGLSSVAVIWIWPPSEPLASWIAPALSRTLVGTSSLSMVITACRVPAGLRAYRSSTFRAGVRGRVKPRRMVSSGSPRSSSQMVIVSMALVAPEGIVTFLLAMWKSPCPFAQAAALLASRAVPSGRASTVNSRASAAAALMVTGTSSVPPETSSATVAWKALPGAALLPNATVASPPSSSV